MNKNGVAAALRSLAAGEKSRSETARLRDVFEDIEAALAAGVSRAAILEELHTQGFTLSLKGFESALYRLRKKKQTNKNDGVKNVEKLECVHAPVIEETATTPQEAFTPKKEIETDDDLDGLSPADQRRIKNERKGDKYFSPQTTNSILNNISKDKGENK